MVVVICMVFSVAVPVNAQNTQDVMEYESIFESKKEVPANWYEEFEHNIVGDKIQIMYYIGSSENVFVPATTSINGKEYTVEPFCTGMFAGCTNIKSVSFSKDFDKKSVGDMDMMFYNCSSLKEVDISGLDTSNVADMSVMFNCCQKITELDLRNFNTSKVTDMGHMFSGCDNLQRLDLSSFDTSKVTDMTGMFFYCISMKNIDLSNFDMSKVTNNTSRETGDYSMFFDCFELQEIKIPLNVKITDELP